MLVEFYHKPMATHCAVLDVWCAAQALLFILHATHSHTTFHADMFVDISEVEGQQVLASLDGLLHLVSGQEELVLVHVNSHLLQTHIYTHTQHTYVHSHHTTHLHVCALTHHMTHTHLFHTPNNS